MHKHRSSCGITAFSLAILFLTFTVLFPVQTVSADSISSLKARRSALEEEETENAAKRESLRADVTQKREYRDSVKQQIDEVEKQLDALVARIRTLDESIAEGEAQIEETRRSIEENLELLKERLRAMYMAGDASAVSIIMNATSFLDYQQKSDMIRAITQHDSELLETLEAQLRSVEKAVEKTNQDKAELDEDKKELDQKSAELTKLYEEGERLLKAAEKDEAEAKAEAERIAKEKEETEAAIDLWYEEYYAALAAANNNAGGIGYIGTGEFLWPMPGYSTITCYFGEGGHRGVDISGSGIYGRDIVAADSGTVIYSGWMGSYGNVVFLDHGNGYSTRYAHASALAVSEGDFVEAGETIAYVGSTGNSTGPHLHFEVLLNGELRDPFLYF